MTSTSPINTFLLTNNLTIASNPCVSPDFCLDWESLRARLTQTSDWTEFEQSEFTTAAGTWTLAADEKGDHAWLLRRQEGTEIPPFEGEPVSLPDSRIAWPATWKNLLRMKNLVQESDPRSTLFPGAADPLGKTTIGVGARFTTLHWPGVDWAMAQLGMGMTANQNSIPRELVYDVDVMLKDELDTVPFPFIGAEVPEGHQGQSVEGMSHGCVLAKLKSGFHRKNIPWSFNADHQPIGGKYDSREDALVRGCLLASYITFDLSPELTVTEIPESPAARADYIAKEIDADLVAAVRERVASVGLDLEEAAFNELLCRVWPAMKKMKARDAKYRDIRAEHFTTLEGRAYLRELSIDELPGLTTPETTAIMLSLCEAMEMPVQFIAPAFGFQKNLPYPDNDELRELVGKQWEICRKFGVSIGFHSGSGKSAENYRVLGEVTDCNLEIKTSGRYTYEMGVALSQSPDPDDQALWRDWFAFTIDLAVAGAFSENDDERHMARSFIEASLDTVGVDGGELFKSEAACREVLEGLEPDPGLTFWFEYNFLYILAANGSSAKSDLGDHSPAGYRQRARFYSISDAGRLNFAKRVAGYLIFLVESTGQVPAGKCDEVKKRLEAIQRWDEFQI